MKNYVKVLLIIVQLAAFQNANAQLQNRKVAVTIDDLPTISLLNSPKQKEEITRKILASLNNRNVPAIGFVNEIKLYTEDKIDTLQVKLLQLWIDVGFEIGNHTYSHFSFHNSDTAHYFKDIIDGQIITSSLLELKKDKVRYFRHPYLHTGNSMVKKKALDEFLHKNDLIVAPVTVDNSDWIFARAYDNAIIAGDSSLMKTIGEMYVEYMENCAAYYEKQSVDLFEYEINQILLLHANSINADYLDEVLDMLISRNYKFVPLAEALEDNAFRTAENFIGEGGISWIRRWALEQDREKAFFKGEPATPDLIIKTAALK